MTRSQLREAVHAETYWFTIKFGNCQLETGDWLPGVSLRRLFPVFLYGIYETLHFVGFHVGIQSVAEVGDMFLPSKGVQHPQGIATDAFRGTIQSEERRVGMCVELGVCLVFSEKR